ncbi:MAG: glyoxylase-like metal-dependent hydrolase (beta-lactamase superfamily II), partial [Pseudoalteromonas tetraodonis]
MDRKGDANARIDAESNVLRSLKSHGSENWSVDLGKVATPGEKPWLAKARAEKIGDGVWNLQAGRYHSDMGGQRLVAAPDGLILIEAHAGLSFEAEWAAIQSVGLDPMQVKFVLATHEHGDHSPGAYLWRVATGAKFVCSEEMAYHLQHHLTLGTGYGFHAPNFTDIVVREDSELDLA